jgi:hypothetical protein
VIGRRICRRCAQLRLELGDLGFERFDAPQHLRRGRLRPLRMDPVRRPDQSEEREERRRRRRDAALTRVRSAGDENYTAAARFEKTATT